ncbi:Glycosyltransferase sdnJ [Apiospora kogelbergensis]|uniref:Glycosyltransferase sdnJ n=1 Tax=Apiospora kogelbergensis TaxID=1337665 RepID=UPI00312D9830
MPERPIVLFFAISDLGYVNVVLATIYELLRQGRLDIHIASFAPLQPRLDSIVQKVKDENPSQPISPIAFHNLAQFPASPPGPRRAKTERRQMCLTHPAATEPCESPC